MATIDDIHAKLMTHPDYAEEYERTKPYADIVLQIVVARHKAGLTQAQLAERAGMTQGAVARLESGNYGFSMSTLLRLVNALGLRIVIGDVA